MSLTKLALRRPVSVILIIVALAVFGLSSIPGFKMQLTPDMEMPMLIVMTAYPGADPESVQELVTEVVEEAGESLSGIDSVTAQSSENVSMVMFTYEYGVDIDECYTDLRTALDTASMRMPSDASTPVVMELNLSAVADMTLSARTESDLDLKKVLEDSLIPELEAITDMAQVELSGGTEEYIRILLDEQALKQYGLNMAAVANYLAAVDFTMPAGRVEQGSQDVAVSATMEYNTVQRLKQVPIITAYGSVVYLSDVAEVSMQKEAPETISKSNGKENISISVQKKQSAGAVGLAADVQEVIEEFHAKHPEIRVTVEYNSAEVIKSSLWSVGKTLIIGVALSMAVLFLFFGDFKASLIVGSSMPISLLATLLLMKAMGFSMNIVTMGSLVIAIGMIVDNSIVVIESCFRASEQERKFKEAALIGTKSVTMSIIASTITTIVVYLPLSLMDDLAGQLFQQLGFTIVFAMLASLISAMTLVPLFYSVFRPKEKKELFINKFLHWTNEKYRALLAKAMHRKGLVILLTIAMMAVSLAMFSDLNLELMPASDEGIVSVSATFRPGTTLKAKEEAMVKLEELAKSEPDVLSYSVSVGSDNTASLTAYLSKERELTTADVVEKWNTATKDYVNMNLEISSSGSTMGTMMTTASVEVDLRGTDMEILKEYAAKAQTLMEEVDGVLKVSSSAADTTSAIHLEIDPLMTMHYGMTPIQVASSVNNILSGMDVLTVTREGTEYDVRMEYPSGLYDDVNKLMEATLTSAQGMQVPLREMAEVTYTDAPQTITKVDGKYQIALTAATTQEAQYTAKEEIQEALAALALPESVELADDMMTEMMTEELIAIGKSIAVAVFLVFLVMAMQFESPRFSFMVMMCVPFSLIGSFFLLWIGDFTISMVSMMGFLMLVGIVVNNGILYVDTVNQLRYEMPLTEALTESGCIRLRPILMTTLTTILSMIPMGLGIGNNAQIMQGMALVIIGGLVASTILTLLLMPTIYLLIDKKTQRQKRNGKKSRKSGRHKRRGKHKTNVRDKKLKQVEQTAALESEVESEM